MRLRPILRWFPSVLLTKPTIHVPEETLLALGNQTFSSSMSQVDIGLG